MQVRKVCKDVTSDKGVQVHEVLGVDEAQLVVTKKFTDQVGRNCFHDPIVLRPSFLGRDLLQVCTIVPVLIQVPALLSKAKWK